MKDGKILSKVLIFLGGFFTPFAIIIPLGLTIDYLHPDIALGLINKPTRVLGSIRIWVQKPLPSERMHPLIRGKVHKQLWMTVGGDPLVVLMQNPDGQITDFHLLKNNEEQPILSMTRSGSPGKWGLVYYGEGGSKGVPQGDVYVDIDFDGRFDCKLVFTSPGELGSRYIYLDNALVEVDDFSIRKKTATAGPTEYAFTPESGWDTK